MVVSHCATPNSYGLVEEILSEWEKDSAKRYCILSQPLAVAVWIMDDGSCSQSHIDLSTYSFVLPEIDILQKGLLENFGVNAKYFRDRDKGYRMYFNVNDSRALAEIVRPYVIPLLEYKISFHNPVTTESPEIGDKIVSNVAYYNTPGFR